MSLDVRFIPAKDIDAHRVESFPYQIANTLPDLEDILPPVDTEEPLGTAFLEPPEDLRRRLNSAENLITERLAQSEQKLAQADQTTSEKLAQTDRIIAEKIAQAEKLVAEKLAEAEQQAAEIGHRAFEEGFASGEKEGRVSGEAHFKVHLSRLEDNLESLSDAVSLHKRASEEEVLALITVMAEYLAAQHLGIAEDAIGPLLHSVMENHPFPLSESAAPGETPVVVFMHPKDLEQAQTGFTTEFPGVRLLADTELSRGSLRVETADAVIDATFERRRERLLQLLNRLREEGQI